MALNVNNVLQLLINRFGKPERDNISRTDRDIATYIIDILEIQKTAVMTDFETYTSLGYVDGYDDSKSDSDDDDTIDDDQGSSSEYEPSPQKKQKFPERSMEEMKDAVKYRHSAILKGSRSISAMQRRYRWIRDANHMQYIERLVKNNGTRMEKLDKINSYVKEKFDEAINNRCRIHDANLKIWALKKRREIDWTDFQASDSWLHRFKRKNKIGIRTITHIVSKKSVQSMDMIKASGNSFVEMIKPMINEHNCNAFFNVDQSGFKKELHSGGTLAYKGVKRVEALVQSVNSTTHSYTIMPLISADGTLHTPMMIVLQEGGDSFGPRVSKTMKRPQNLYITCTKSGLVKKNLMDEWFLNVFLKGYPKEKHLLCDSLSTYKNTANIDQSKPEDQTYHIHFIPAGTTGFIQPLDVFFFRQWKTFVKKISDYVIMEDIDCQLFQRDNLLILQSLVHEQFVAPLFRPFIRQAWRKAGYLDLIEEVINPIKYCFDGIGSCEQNCDKTTMIKCSWCRMELCFYHFFTRNHTHTF